MCNYYIWLFKKDIEGFISHVKPYCVSVHKSSNIAFYYPSFLILYRVYGNECEVKLCLDTWKAESYND